MNVKAVFASTPVLERLRAETRPQHHAIETALELTSDTLTLGTYRQTLARFHGLYRPLEGGVQAVGGWADRGRDLVGRWKPPPLESDLRALGEDDPAALPLCTDLLPHATVAAACGCLGVGYGDRTGKNGAGVPGDAHCFCGTPCDQDEIVSAAKDTSLKLHPWIETGASHQ